MTRMKSGEEAIPVLGGKEMKELDAWEGVGWTWV